MLHSDDCTSIFWAVHTLGQLSLVHNHTEFFSLHSIIIYMPWSFYCLLRSWHLTSLLAKFLCSKGIIFSFWQGCALDVLAAVGIIQSHDFWLGLEHIQEAIQNVLVILEMVIFSVLQQYTHFQWNQAYSLWTLQASHGWRVRSCRLQVTETMKVWLDVH
ncbi:hypothetical protein BRADI_1g39346v3 [Brachypodium distachyon]|uniref:Uncharacterized protein n=1 Tax=Brachypodium distachyon TaxID=15368 RepID=A0A0Q3JKS3_BRADI|nr:hypothetical protein BRADI_1g39346v3 [Brachypodium distachyon]